MKILKELDVFAKGIQSSQIILKTCVIYTRVSTKEQAENNLSLETQRKACEQYAKKHGLKIMAFFGGTYESAKTDERQEFNRMISFVKGSRDKISYIIVFSVDRFSRSGANAIYIAAQLKEQGIHLASVIQPVDVSSPSGILQQNIQFIFSQYDNQLRREKCMTGMQNRFKKGEWCLKPPRGYDVITLNGKRSIVVNKDGDMIRKAFMMKYYESLSQTEIVYRLSLMGFSILKQALSRTFRNPFYCGIISTRSLNGKLVVGKHEKLVSQEFFMAVNNMLAKKHTNTIHTRDNPELSLRRFVKCNVCKKPMTGYLLKAKKLYYYKCRTTGCCVNLSAIKAHRLFADFLGTMTLDNKNFPELQKDFTENLVLMDRLTMKNDTSFKANLKRLKNKIEQLEERFVFKEISATTYQKYFSKLTKEKINVEREIDKLKTDLIAEKVNVKPEATLNLSELWSSGTFKLKKMIQATVFPAEVYWDKTLGRFLSPKLGKGFVYLK